MQQHNLRVRIIGCKESETGENLFSELAQHADVTEFSSQQELEYYLFNQTLLTLPEVLMLEVTDTSKSFDMLERIRKNVMLKGLIVIFFSAKKDNAWFEKAKKFKVHDYYVAPFCISNI